MSAYIKLELSDWLYNAGIVGIVNILKHADNVVEFDGQSVSFGIECLDNFEEKYFNYFIDTYEKTMTYTRILEKIEKILNICIDDKKIDKEKLENLKKDINYIKDKMKRAAYKDVKLLVDKMDLDKNIQIKELKQLLIQNRNKILKIENIGYYNQQNKKSTPNAIIDKYLNTGMINIDKFYEDILEYAKCDKDKYKFNCCKCYSKIKEIKEGLSFLNRIYFDTARKTSNVWNFESDIEVCPICKLVYYCVPAGFTTIYGKGMFINANHSVENAVDINFKIKHEILNNNESNRSNSTFKALITALHESINDEAKYELADIQVVRYEDEKYRFNLLSRNILKVLNESKEELNYIIKCGFKEINTYFNIYEETLNKLLNNENLFMLIHKTLIFKISGYSDLHYNIGHIKNINKINFNFMRGVGYMENIERDILKSASGAGYYLKEAYKSKNSENKLDGIAYRLLNALKTNNKSMFMDTLLNCYLYTNKLVPQFFIDCLKDEIVFKTIGYSFVSGLIDGEEYKKTNEGGNN
ncbi:MAG TPA: type I-B CRISPR-associated protein Cas8b1/Cst1 [Clostridiales bacterium]|nr:type I-B CRISPR-associated protein Cas8b1/Cst1 [Clostridiales bacterium]